MPNPRRKKLDDDGWDLPAVGEDTDTPSPQKRNSRVNWTREAFWVACDIISLSVPRWSSVPRTNANIKHLLESYSEEIVRDSFQFFRNESDRLDLGKDNAAWDVYFRRRQRYLDQAVRARQGARPGQPVRKLGDVAVDKPSPPTSVAVPEPPTPSPARKRRMIRKQGTT